MWRKQVSLWKDSQEGRGRVAPTATQSHVRKAQGLLWGQQSTLDPSSLAEAIILVLFEWLQSNQANYSEANDFNPII